MIYKIFQENFIMRQFRPKYMKRYLGMVLILYILVYKPNTIQKTFCRLS